MTIPLGYEIGTGRAVSIPLRHLAVTGQTQLSGKTSTLEALISRSGLRAVAFITKRGEAGFQRFSPTRPYFENTLGEGAWQFVSSLLEATVGEKLKMERSFIMRACKGATTLHDVQRNIRAGLQTAKGFAQSMYTVLDGYLDLVLPQIDKLPYAKTLTLARGVNVMDLAAYTSEVQALVIRSVLRWVYRNERDVITIIPEAWEMIPQGHGSPVLEAAEELIRKGGVNRNWIWLDSQDLAAVNKRVLKSVGVYILGVQLEENEVVRTIKHMTLSPKPKPDEVRALGLGQFYVCFNKAMVKVYVQPTWADEEEARAAALSGGGIVPQPKTAKKVTAENTQAGVGDWGLGIREEAKPAPPVPDDSFDMPDAGEEDRVWKEKYEEAQKRIAALEGQIEGLQTTIQELESFRKNAPETIRHLEKELASLREAKTPVAQGPPYGPAALPDVEKPQHRKAGAALQSPAAVPTKIDNLNEIYAELRARLLADPQVLQVLAQQPEIEVQVRRQVVSLDGGTLPGRLASLIAEGWFKEPHTLTNSVQELKRRGVAQAPPNVLRQLQKLAQMGFLLREADKSYRAAPGMKVTRRTIEAEVT